MSSLEGTPTVAILMGTYNGARYLAEQLDSLETQIGCDWCLFASDDGSSDDTREILHAYKIKWGVDRMQVRQGPQAGYALNFLSLASDKTIVADYYAFCDQDDVWFPNKLEAAISRLATITDSGPKLYGGRTVYVREDLTPFNMSPCFALPPTFRNAIVQSIAGGNTMVFDQAAKQLFEVTGALKIVSHDWWAYQLVSGCSGKVVYDEVPYLYYRQHNQAIVGGNRSIMDRAERFFKLILGRFRQWNDLNVLALNYCKEWLAADSKLTLELFEKLRNGRLKDRVRLVEVAGIYRQTWMGTISLYLAAILKKL